MWIAPASEANCLLSQAYTTSNRLSIHGSIDFLGGFIYEILSSISLKCIATAPAWARFETPSFPRML
jgi:hypothetical protein